MNTTKEQFSNATRASQASMETMLTLAQTAFASAERLASLNLTVARGFLDDSVANAKAVLAIKDIQGLMALQNSLAQPPLEKIAAYSRSVYQIATDTQGVLSEVVAAQVTDLQRSLATSIDKAGNASPAGSADGFVAAKSLFAAINASYEQMSKVSRQMGEAAQANVSAATAATLKAVGVRAAPGRKAA